MGDRRLHKPQQRLTAAVVPPAITKKDYRALKLVGDGRFGSSQERKRLASMGMLTSQVASRASLTSLGLKAMASFEAANQRHEIQATAAPTAPRPLASRDAWLRKFANGGNPRGCCHY